MPKIDELLKSSKKMFIKSEYRPWNYMDEIENEIHKNNIKMNSEPIKNQVLDVILVPNETSLSVDNVQLQKYHSSKDKKDKEVVTFVSKQLYHDQNIKDQSSQDAKIVENENRIFNTIFQLSGHQRAIFFFIVDKCILHGLLTTGAIKKENLITLCKTSIKMVKTSIQRIVSKGLVVRNKGKTGRGGFYNFAITELVKNAVLDYQQMSNTKRHLDIKSLDQQQVPKIDNRSSSHYLQGEWRNIIFDPLENIGFSETQLKQLYNKNTPEIVQESIYHFAYGIEHNPKCKNYSEPLNVLMGVLRKGQAWIESNYKSPQEIAMEQILEQKRLRQERESKLKDELIKTGCDDWLEQLPSAEKENIIASFNIPAGMKNSREIIIKMKLIEYFKQYIFDKV